MNYIKYKNKLKRQGATQFRDVKNTITSIDETLVTVTRFKYTDKNNHTMYGAIEPETGFYETNIKPIGKIS